MLTQISDVIVPSVYGSYVDIDSPEKTAFVQSGVVATGEFFDKFALGPSQTFTIPFWNDLNASVEPNYSNDVYTDIAEPNKITTGSQGGMTAYLNEGWSSADLVKELAGVDPNQKVAEKVNRFWDRQFQRRVLATSIGIYNDNVAENGGDMVIDVSSQTAGTVGALNRFSSDAFIDAAFTMGDDYGELAAIAVHSMVARTMLKNDEIETIRDSEGNMLMQTYKGKRVIIDDGMPTIGTGVDRKYISVAFGNGALGWGRGAPKTPSEIEREAARANGGGIETLWERRTWLIHPAGYRFLANTVTGPGISPKWSDLALANNWERVVDRRQVKMAFIVSNG